MSFIYKHLVFRPPKPPMYSGKNGTLTVRTRPSSITSAQACSNDFRGSTVEMPLRFIRTAKDNEIATVFFECKKSKQVILYSHGNGEDLKVAAETCYSLSRNLECNVLCYDYSGYGQSTGSANEQGCYSDIEAAHLYLLERHLYQARDIILMGWSLGTGPTIHLAKNLGTDVGGVVLCSAFTSIIRVPFWNAPRLPFDMFTNIDKIARIAVPVFVVHGTRDDMIPVGQGRSLYEKCQFPVKPLYINGAGHMDIYEPPFQDLVICKCRDVLQFFKSWKPPETEKARRRSIFRWW